NFPPSARVELYRRIAAHITLLLIRLQVAGIYLHASMAKTGVEEWADGTAMYYWLLNSDLGAPLWLRPPIRLVLLNSLVVAVTTWGVILFELLLGCGLILSKGMRRYLLFAGVTFHAGIAVIMGLFSFSTAMCGALLLFLRPTDEPLTLFTRTRFWEAVYSSTRSEVTTKQTSQATMKH